MGAKSQSTEPMGQSLSLDEFLQGIASSMVARGNGGNDVWPAPRLDLDRTLCCLAPTLLRGVASFSETLPHLELLRHPSAFAELSYYLLARPTGSEQSIQWQAAAEFLCRAIEHMRGADVFCENGNRLQSGFRIEESLAVLDTYRLDADGAAVGTLVALLNVYVEFLHFAFVAFSKEIHGPYTFGGGSWVIYEFDWLNGSHFDFSRAFPLKSVQIGIDLAGKVPGFDFHGRYSGSARHFRSIWGRCTTADGASIPLNCVWLTRTLLEAIREATHEMAACADDKLLRLLAVSQYHGLQNVTAGAFPGLEEDDLGSFIAQYSDSATDEWLHQSLSGLRTLSPQERKSQLVALLDPRNLSKGLR